MAGLIYIYINLRRCVTAKHVRIYRRLDSGWWTGRMIDFWLIIWLEFAKTAEWIAVSVVECLLGLMLRLLNGWISWKPR